MKRGTNSFISYIVLYVLAVGRPFSYIHSNFNFLYYLYVWMMIMRNYFFCLTQSTGPIYLDLDMDTRDRIESGRKITFTFKLYCKNVVYCSDRINELHYKLTKWFEYVINWPYIVGMRVNNDMRTNYIETSKCLAYAKFYSIILLMFIECCKSQIFAFWFLK